MNNPIYLDFAATTPAAPEAVAAMLPYLTKTGVFANPASIQHSLGEAAESAVKNVRAQMAELLRCQAADLVFTSGATEANNLALQGIALAYRHQGQHIITSASEHKSVLDTCKYLQNVGFDVTYLRPDSRGLISLDGILDAIGEQTILVSIMHVNNETGGIQDIERIAEALAGKKPFFHVDAAQSAGKLAIDLSNTPIDLLSVSAHKFYGPKGIGCLHVRDRKRTKLFPLLHGGGQEYGLRPGTLPTHQIVGMGAAFRLAHENLAHDMAHCKGLKQLLLEQLYPLQGVTLNGEQAYTLPNIVNVSFDGVSSDALLIALKDRVALSSGSACNSGAIEASHVLRAMGIEGDRLYGAVRISFGRYTSEVEIRQAAHCIGEAVIRLRQLAAE